jgi:hypothetical protein
MSSISILFAARSSAVGIKDQIPRSMLRRKTTLEDLIRLGKGRTEEEERKRKPTS